MNNSRYTSLLPDYFKTPYNLKTADFLEDRVFEPGKGWYIHGYISDKDTPPPASASGIQRISEKNPVWYDEQLSKIVAYKDDVTGVKSGGVLAQDLINMLRSNGALGDDDTLMDVGYYVYAPPIDYDKFINHSRYYWVGSGDSITEGEYIVKERAGSVVVIHQNKSGQLVPINVNTGDTPPSNPATGDLWEDASTKERYIRVWNGGSWAKINFTVVDDLSATGNDGDYFYHASVFSNRPTVHQYVPETGRWISRHVVVGVDYPTNPVKGMIYESHDGNKRVLKIYDGSSFVDLDYRTGARAGTNAEYVYDNTVEQDGWKVGNLWVHLDDLSPKDREAVTSEDQAIRPIIEFWGGIEAAPSSTKVERNQAPEFKLYAVDDSGVIYDTGNVTTIFQYDTDKFGINDQVLGFPLKYDEHGQFVFKLSLEEDAVSYKGYGSFVDAETGYAHNIWRRSDKTTKEVVSLSTAAFGVNPNHQVPATVSRNSVIDHFMSVISSQDTFEGDFNGRNSYRYSAKNPVVGAKIIDCEYNLFPLAATMQDERTDIPSVIRSVSRDYSAVLGKIAHMIDSMWDGLEICDPAGNPYGSASELLDVVLSSVFYTDDPSLPYYYSGMGTFTERRMDGTTPIDVSIAPRNIRVPQSPVKIGAYPATQPRKVVREGKTYLLGHEGTLRPAHGDFRDDIWLELHQRFYDSVDDGFKLETTGYSASHSLSKFNPIRSYGRQDPLFIAGEVEDVVDNYRTVTSPVSGFYMDKNIPSIFFYDGSNWIDKGIMADEIWRNKADGGYYLWNGWKVVKVKTFDNGYPFDYSFDEYQQIVRAEFERYVTVRGIDFVTNEQFDKNDRFTWNYSSAGLPGHYRGIYTRLYRTPDPHIEPWKIAGYEDEPDWWTATYPPTSVDADGSYRYADTHAMWSDLQAGKYGAEFKMTAPIPVDGSGDLLDPIAAGIVDENDLVTSRLDEDWKYRDGAPAEEQFYRSPEYAFAKVLAGILMKPAMAVGNLWSTKHVDSGMSGPYQYYGGTQVVHTGSMRRQDLTSTPVHLEKDDHGNVIVSPGLNSWISETLLRGGIDITEHFGKKIRNSTTSLAWVTHGFVKPDTISVWMSDGKKIPFEDVQAIMYRSQPIARLFASGVQILSTGNGFKVYGYDTTNPRFVIDEPAAEVFSGQVELFEDFTAKDGQTEFNLTKFNLSDGVSVSNNRLVSVLVNGYKVQDKFYEFQWDKLVFSSAMPINSGDIVRVVMVTTQGNTRSKANQFVVDGVAFNYVDVGSGIERAYDYGHFFNDATSVINFLVGYGRKLARDGWIFTSRDFVDGAKAFASWALRHGKNDGEVFAFTPFDKGATIVAPFGQPVGVESIQHGVYGAVDIDANPISPDDIRNQRTGNKLEIVVTGDSELYGCRVNIVTYQHVVCFNNVTRFGDFIYDPVRGVGQKWFRISAYSLIEDWNGTITTPGFTVSSLGAIPSFDVLVDQVNHLNNAYDPHIDSSLRDAHRKVYGWYDLEERTLRDGRSVPMMGAVNADHRTAFNFHRGMIHAKGTDRTMRAFARGIPNGDGGIEVSEGWLWKLDEAGDRPLIDIELAIENIDDKSPFTVYSFRKTAVDPTVKIVPPYVRGEVNTIWNKQPHLSANGEYQIPELPFIHGKFDQSYVGTVNIVDRDEDSIVLYMFHYDPLLGWKYNDPKTLSEIDYIDTADPVDYGDSSSWGMDKVGSYWWDQTHVWYGDYHHKEYASEFERAVHWGKLREHDAKVWRVEDEVFVQFIEDDAVISHKLKDGDRILVSGATQMSYNREARVTVVDDATVKFKIRETPSTPATGQIRVKTGFIDVYQWIVSPVPPNSYDQFVLSNNADRSFDGTPAFGKDTPFIKSDVIINGAINTRYFFWIKGSSTVPAHKTYTTSECESRIENPTLSGIPWFAVSSERELIVQHGYYKLDSTKAIRIAFSRQNNNNHADWVFLFENKSDGHYDEKVVNKIVDSLVGVDEYGRTVPDPLLPEVDKYGTSFFPIRTVFKDRADAIYTFNKKLNGILKTSYLDAVPYLTAIFDSASEGSWWSKEIYAERGFEDAVDKPFDHVVDTATMSARLAEGRYRDGDVIRVRGTKRDIWGGSPVDTYHVIENGVPREIGVMDGTVSVKFDTNTDASLFRSFIRELRDKVLTARQFNDLILELARATIRENLFQNWLIKSSYVKMKVKEPPLDTFTTVQPSYTDAAEAMFLETKPYHTKLLGATASYDANESIETAVEDDAVVRPVLVFDRLSCGEDVGWDVGRWDVTSKSWDFKYWTADELGQNTYVNVGSVQCDGSDTYTFVPSVSTIGHNLQATFYKDGVKIDPSVDGYDFEITNTGVITIKLSANMPSSYRIELLSSLGMTIGDFGVNDDTAHVSSFEHQAIRNMEMGLKPCSGSDAEERIIEELTEKVSVAVTTKWTTAYTSIDPNEASKHGWNVNMADPGDRVFFIGIDKNDNMPSVSKTIKTKQSASFNSPYVVFDYPNPERIQYQGHDLIEGVHYSYDPTRSNRSVELLGAKVSSTITGGISATYPVPKEFFNGYSAIYLDGMKLVNGVDYTDNGDNTITFTQPTSATVPEFGKVGYAHFVGDGSRTSFNLGTINTVNRNNTIVFLNGKYTPVSDYLISSGHTITMTTPPAFGDDLLVYHVSSPSFVGQVIYEDTFTGDGTTTAFTVTGANPTGYMVFINGSYVDTTAFTISSGQLVFNTAPAAGDTIHLKYTTGSSDSVLVDTFASSGAMSDNTGLKGIVDSHLIVAVNGSINIPNTDYIVKNALGGDVIEWYSAPVAASQVDTIRLDRIEMGQVVPTSVYPKQGMNLMIYPNDYFGVVGQIEAQFKRFPVGPIGSYKITKAPNVGYKIDARGSIVLDDFTDDTIEVKFDHGALDPLNKSFLSVRPDHVVERMEPDHLVWDSGGVEIGRINGTRVLNTSDNTIYTWNGTSWVSGPVVATSEVTYVKDRASLFEFDGTSHNWVSPYIPSNTRDQNIFMFPKYGEGTTYGTLLFGDISTSTTFKEANMIYNHVGAA